MVDREHNSLGATERGWEELCGRRWVLTEMADVIVMPPWKIMTVGRGSWAACPLDISTPPKDKKVMRTSQHRFPKSKSSFANEITFSDKGNLRRNDWLCRRGENGGFNITDFSRAFDTTSYCISNLTQKLRKLLKLRWWQSQISLHSSKHKADKGKGHVLWLGRFT